MSEHALHTTKHYHNISEIAKLFKVSTSLLRYWERVFSQLKPRRTKQGIRKYSQADIKEIKIIYNLVKEQGYTIQGAKEALNNYHKNPKSTQELVITLKSLKAFLMDLRQSTR